MTLCPCGSRLDYLTCCGPYHNHTKVPTSPEALMRSRYSAYALADTAYIKDTMRGKPAIGFDELEAKQWSRQMVWIGLSIIKSSCDNPNEGFVEFKASFVNGEQLNCMHERSTFLKEDGRWFYVDGVQIQPKTPKANQRIGRGTPCPCGSKKKYKNCHG